MSGTALCAGRSILAALPALLLISGCNPDAPIAPTASGPAQAAALPAKAVSFAEARARWESLHALGSTGDDTVRVSFATPIRLNALRPLLKQSGVRVLALSHAFASGNDLQVGIFSSDQSAVDDVLREYEGTNRSFLHEGLRLTGLAQADELRPRERASYQRMMAAYRQRLVQWDNGGPFVHELRLAGSPGALATLGHDLNGADSVFPDGRDVMSPRGSLQPTRSAVAFVQAAGVGSPAVGGFLKSCEFYGTCPPPPPPPKPLYSISDPYNDNTFSDNNTVRNNMWAPSEGKIWVGQDQYSKYVYHHLLWGSGTSLLGYLGGNTGHFSFEIESHQTTRLGRTIFGKDFYEVPYAKVAESSLPNPYIDTQASDPSDIENHAMGSNSPERLAGFTFYYAWIRFRTNVGGTFGQFQVAVQLGEKFGGACFNTAWCTLSSLETVRVLPWLCNFMGPNHLYFNNLWKRWRYDLAGFKNEQCA